MIDWRIVNIVLGLSANLGITCYWALRAGRLQALAENQGKIIDNYEHMIAAIKQMHPELFDVLEER